jgi:hypothetical protein
MVRGRESKTAHKLLTLLYFRLRAFVAKTHRYTQQKAVFGSIP